MLLTTWPSCSDSSSWCISPKLGLRPWWGSPNIDIGEAAEPRLEVRKELGWFSLTISPAGGALGLFICRFIKTAERRLPVVGDVREMELELWDEPNDGQSVPVLATYERARDSVHASTHLCEFHRVVDLH